MFYLLKISTANLDVKVILLLEMQLVHVKLKSLALTSGDKKCLEDFNSDSNILANSF